MARIYRQTGSLHDLLDKIGDDSIKNLDDINAFKKNYPTALAEMEGKARLAVLGDIQEIRSRLEKLSTDFNAKLTDRKNILEHERDGIVDEIGTLSRQQDNFFRTILHQLKKRSLIRRKEYLEKYLDREAAKPLDSLGKQILNTANRLKDDESNIENLIRDRAWPKRNRLEKTKAILQQNYELYLGAVGEENVLEELKKLPDAFFIINDFRKEFYPPIYNRKSDDRIHSIQIDHLVCGPSGLFIVETKNWSEASSENINLFSPIKQVQRANFAMFVFLNQAVESGYLQSFVNHWGDIKISPINIVATIHAAPPQEFQYVKVLQFNTMRSQIETSKKIFSEDNIEDLERFLTGELS